MRAFGPGYEEPSTLLAKAAACGEGEGPERAELIARLQRRTDAAAFAAAAEAAASSDLALRLAAVDVLGQFGYAAQRPYREQTLPILVGTADQAAEPRLLQAAISAIAHLGDGRALTTVLRYVAHRDAGVRRMVAFALNSVLDESDAEAAPAAIEALIALSGDPDESVRDWATFGLGELPETADSPAVRDALAARLDDSAPHIAEQARTALAERADPPERQGDAGHARSRDADSPGPARDAARAHLH